MSRGGRGRGDGPDLRVVDMADWPDVPEPDHELGPQLEGIAVGTKGKPLATEGNVGLLVHHSSDWDVVFDEFAQLAVVRGCPSMGAAPPRMGPLDEYHLTIARNWLAITHGLDAKKEAVKDGVIFASKQAHVDPLKAYVRGLEWDGKVRLNTWLRDYVGAEDTAEVSDMGRMWMVSAIARALEPGCKADYMLVLIGAQGMRKTSVFEALCPEMSWFQPDLPDLSNKDAMQSLLGSWIVNCDEMSALRRSDAIEIAKNFLTRRADRFRMPYKPLFAMFPRRCVFAGTSNQRQILMDPTGSRRFWCVDVGAIDIEALRQDRDQLWAEARTRWEQKEQHWPTRESESAIVTRNRDSFTWHDEWSARIEKRCSESDAVTIAELMTALGFEADAKMSMPDQRRVAGVLMGLGWEQSGRRVTAGRSERTWKKKK